MKSYMAIKKTIRNRKRKKINNSESRVQELNDMALNQNLVPIVIEKTGRGERSYDIFSRLLKDRIIFLGGPVDDSVANLIIAQMLFLSNEDSKKDVDQELKKPE